MANQQPQPSAEFLAETQSPTVKAVMWLMTGMAMLFLGLRLCVRLHLKRIFGWDDVIAAVAVACLIGYAAVCHAAADIGLGRHIQYVSMEPQNLIGVARYSSISQTLAILACALGKTSFAVTLLRIVIQKWMNWLLWFIIITMNIANLLAALFVFVKCKDPRSNWDPSIVSKCWPDYVFTNYSLFVGAYSGLQDFLLALLPWTIVWNLQMKKKEKMGVAFAMSLGILSSAGTAAIVKTAYLVKLSARADFTWEIVPLLNWAAVEDSLTIIASSIPTLRPLLTKIFPSTTSQESYNMLPPPPPSYEKKRNIRFDTSIYATQVDRDREVTDPRDNSSQTMILPVTRPKPSTVDNKNQINLTTEVSVLYKSNDMV
ncbi:hypothetical protein AN5664.2 [Aspergillus nidulans FGSC A4]|uniref:Rhodopsin domain-containing protein n=1 Tax=Emericella nidulans (strain FGSC A4 / ATCC 38163 / CBS 112.46 / NRRL 194 / M139) TaxID=227321 RepID=Q5B1B6_EMENI|nr:hypothetical protein [Aspergillus nidulans FGSC A4]EAA62757.1 hypothetical protein AN5664.2 [Aspergillus nidulans FGSC A4]CBF81448.1 TPA: conserved hypothetical protein [Aspergillus nidulans FGSC A4]|eukprot:XP_663268.1 hypothetical protein AN5664.2 [Aspergillus nidulans FGSC A4]